MAIVSARSYFDSVSTEFDVATEDLSHLEIRGTEKGLHYFYDRERAKGRALVKDFILEDKPRTATVVTVTLVKKPEGCSPRLRFWKKDKTKVGQAALEVLDSPDTASVKASVDTADAHENLWKLIAFLQSFRGIVLPEEGFSVVADDAAKLADLLRSEDKGEVLEAIRTALGSTLTEKDISLIADRKQELAEFERLLNDDGYFAKHRLFTKEAPEAVWQNFFERNQWIFGYGLNLIAMTGMDEGKLERYTTGANVFTRSGNRIDALMRSRGFISTLLFCEIKTHRTPLLGSLYREPATYGLHKELTGSVAQVQKTTRKALRQFSDQMTEHIKASGERTGTEYSVSRPRQVVVIGKLDQFDDGYGVNPEKLETFELFRTSLSDTEIITYDELYQRARFIVEN
jgi:Shedu protein SduA, C-terminal